MIKQFTLILTLVLVLPARAQHLHHGTDIPNEMGQSAFAALSEIVTTIRNQPNTNWSEIDIDALRNHLVDMDNLITRSHAQTREKENQVIFTVTGAGSTIRSIQNMMKAHAPMLANETGWSVMINNQKDGAMMTISAKKGEKAMIKALGFYGVI